MAIWQNWCFGQFCHSKIEKQTRSLSQFSLVTGFFWENERKYFTHIPGPWSSDMLHGSKIITKTLSMEGNPESSWDRELRAGSQEMLLVIYVNHATTNCLFLEPYNTTKQKITAIMCRKLPTSLSFDRILCCIYFGYMYVLHFGLYAVCNNKFLKKNDPK